MYNVRKCMRKKRTVETFPAARIEARGQYVLAVDVSAFLLGVLLFFLLSRIPLLISPLAFFFLCLSLAVAAGIHGLRWIANGIRTVCVDGEGLSVERGKKRTVLRVERDAIRSVRAARFPGSRRVIVELRDGGPRSVRRPARLVIGAETFPPKDFERLEESLGRFVM